MTPVIPNVVDLTIPHTDFSLETMSRPHMAIIEVQVNGQLNEIGGLRSFNAALKRKVENIQVQGPGAE